jgi:dTDP-4-dehydrorhamnose reductase
MRLLLTGALGMLAADVKRRRPAGVELIETDLGELDITDGGAVEAFFDASRPGAVLNCAAYTAVDRAEADPAAAFAVNETGPRNLAVACARRDIPLVHVSTDYVFFGDGTRPMREEDPCRPQGVYARSKRAGEEAVERAGGRWLTVRTSWLYGLGGANFPDTILRMAAERDRLTVVDDQRGSPTFSEDLAGALWLLLDRGAGGYVHFCNRGECSWCEFALEIIRQGRALGLLAPERRVDVAPIRSDELDRPAPRPSYSVLSTERYVSIAGSPPAPWEDALERFLRARRG